MYFCQSRIDRLRIREGGAELYDPLAPDRAAGSIDPRPGINCLQASHKSGTLGFVPFTFAAWCEQLLLVEEVR